MLYLLPLNKTVTLDNFALNTGAIMIIRSTTLDLTVKPGATDPTADKTAINLMNKSSEGILLQIAFLRSENSIVFNSAFKGPTGALVWGDQETVQLQGTFVGPDTSITIYNHDDRFQILIDYRTVHYYTKRSDATASALSYSTNANQTSPFSHTLTVDAYPAFANLMARD